MVQQMVSAASLKSLASLLLLSCSRVCRSCAVCVVLLTDQFPPAAVHTDCSPCSNPSMSAEP